MKNFLILTAIYCCCVSGSFAQSAADVSRERADYVAWLATAPNSPLAALAQQQVGTSLRLGPPDADIPLEGLAEHRVSSRGGSLTLEGPDGSRSLSTGRPIKVGEYTLYRTASSRGPLLTVFGTASRRRPPGYYPYDSSLVFTGRLTPSQNRAKVRVLAPDGVEVEATEAGSLLVPLGGSTRLRVLRIPSAGGEESELEIFFRDESNARGSYPAGRFVNLIPVGNGDYRLDFNRARNPFCAYSSAYACPAPWSGNTIPAALLAGERYPAAETAPLH